MANDTFSRPLVYPVPADRPATVQHNIRCQQAGSHSLEMDVYTPAGVSSDACLPAVLFIHGGPLPAELEPKPKEWGVFTSYGRLAAAMGFIGVTFNHPLFTIHDLAQSIDDVRAVIHTLRENSAAYHVDPERLCLWGFSGGGPLLSFALRESLPHIRCLIAFYALLDLHHPDDETAAQLSEQDKHQFSATDALTANESSTLPLFVARAGQDHPVLNSGLDRFIQQAIRLNRPLTLMNHPTGRHGFDIFNDDERSREIIGAAWSFIKTHSR